MSSRRPVPGSHNCSQSAEVLFFYLLRDTKVERVAKPAPPGAPGTLPALSDPSCKPVPGVASFVPISQVGSVNHSTPGRKPRLLPSLQARVLWPLTSVSGVCTANSNHLESQPESYATISEQFLKVAETDSCFKRFSSHFYLMCSVLNSDRREQSPVTLGKHTARSYEIGQ